MQKLTVATLALIFMFLNLSSGQDMTSREIKTIANSFTQKLQDKNREIENIVISDFTDGKVAPTELGRFLAEEFAFYLSDLDDGRITVLDRSQLEYLLKEQGLIRDELIDPLSAVKLGKLKGMKHLVYGTIINSGEVYTIYVKLIEVETQRILASTRGTISKVPSLPKHVD